MTPAWDAAFGSVSRVTQIAHDFADEDWEPWEMDRWLRQTSMVELAVVPMFIVSTLGFDQHWDIDRLRAALKEEP